MSGKNLRAGPLSHTSVIDRLQRDFVSTWILAKDLPALAETHADALVRELARRAHASYQYPVDSQVYTPDGELADQVAANEHPDGTRYLSLLASAAPGDR